MVNRSALLLCMVLVFSFFLPPQLLQWQPDTITSGQWWRLFTGHLVHLNVNHLLLNLAGVLILALLFPRFLPADRLLWITLLMAAAISLGLLSLRPDLASYRGFSGCIHGLAAILAMRGLKTDRWFSIILLAALSVKLVLEGVGLDRSETTALIGGPVIWEAHALGFASGLLIAGAGFIRRRTPKQSSLE